MSDGLRVIPTRFVSGFFIPPRCLCASVVKLLYDNFGFRLTLIQTTRSGSMMYRFFPSVTLTR